MGKPIYFTDPVVAAAYHVHPGEFAFVADDAEAAWLADNHHGYDLAATGQQPPAAYFVHPDAPLPFVAYGIEPPAPSPPPPSPPPPPPPPPPAPAPTQLTVGPEDTITRIDVDGDGRADVLVVTDRPPQNP